MYSSLFGHGNSIAGTTYGPGPAEKSPSWPVKTRRLSHLSISGAFEPSWIEINGSDQDRAVSLEMTGSYLFSGYSLNCLPVFLKSTLQVPRMKGAAGLGQVFKRRTGHGASDSAVSVASIPSHGLGEGGPKEIIFEFNQVPVP